MIACIIYLLCIIAANVLAVQYTIPLGSELSIPAGTIAIAPIFTLRDSVQHRYGSRAVVYLVLGGAIVSLLISLVTSQQVLGRIAVAGLIAFVLSELLDTAIYMQLSRYSWLSRVLASNTVACAIDSLLFLSIAFGLDWGTFAAQYLAKLLISTVAGLVLLRAHRDTAINQGP